MITTPHLPFSREDLAARGFDGFLTLNSLKRKDARVPTVPGVYAAIRPSTAAMTFLSQSVGGHHKRRNPTVTKAELELAAVPGAQTVYIGRAIHLQRRIDELVRFGRGEPVGHWGGRYLWQLEDHDHLEIAWRPAADYKTAEASLLDDFVNHWSVLPYANLRLPQIAAR
jgi:hypothetical protein